MDTKRLDLPVGGMSCAGCAARIEKTLQGLPGVCQAQVNFATEKATVHYDPAALTAEKIIQEVQEIGYEVPAQRLTMPISGMRCASCAATIERALHTVPGVIEAQVNVATERATIAYIPALVAVDTLPPDCQGCWLSAPGKPGHSL